MQQNAPHKNKTWRFHDYLVYTLLMNDREEEDILGNYCLISIP
jgi:hypothetical protein